MCDFSYNYDVSRPGSAVKIADLISLQYCDLQAMCKANLAARPSSATPFDMVVARSLESRELRP